MLILDKVAAMQSWALENSAQRRRIALVPTMGSLHAGHVALIQAARACADQVVVSLFVNPTQFGPNEDFDRYPRDPERDTALCRAEGVDVLFAPLVAEMYPPGCSVIVDEDRVSRTFEGALRPGHFRGVLTVVSKLFLATHPHVAVFGEKDAQQLYLIRRMTRDLLFPVSILAQPTVREADGLALSSRNVYLAPEQRAQAIGLSRALDEAEQAYQAGERSAGALRGGMRETLSRYPLGVVDYAELVDEATFEPVQGLLQAPVRALLAVRFGKTRLIDNRRL